MRDMEGLLNKVADLAVKAGSIMLSDSDVEVGNKGTKENYVTSTDLKVQRFLREGLATLLPGAVFRGEEDDLPREDEGTRGEYVWIVDPIDGTANYARDFGESAVSIALAKDDEPVLGVVRNPYARETYCAIKGRGAFLNGTPIHVSDRSKENAMICLSWSAYDKSRSADCFRISQDLYAVCEDIRRTGSAAYELCLLARGSVDMHFEIRLAPWDYAAGGLIIEEAGGRTGSLEGRLDMRRQCLVMAANSEKNFAFLKGVVSENLSRRRCLAPVHVS